MLGLQPGGTPVANLSAGFLAGRFAQRPGMRDADGVLGRRDTAVRAGLDNNGFLARFEFRYPGFELTYLLILVDQITVQDIICEGLLMQLLSQFRRVKIFGEAHVPEELFATPGELHPVGRNAPPKPRVEVLFHTAKVKKETICANSTI